MERFDLSAWRPSLDPQAYLTFTGSASIQQLSAQPLTQHTHGPTSLHHIQLQDPIRHVCFKFYLRNGR